MSHPSNVDERPFQIDGEPKAEFIPEAGTDFVITPYIQNLTERALAYLTIGYPVHLSGPAGTGKSTLAMHIASQLGRPCTLLHGDDEFKASDLLGRDTGYQRSSVVDNYVSSIVKTEESLAVVWSSNRLTTACQKGHTLIYDEFTRSPATANNPFLSVLEEGILNIPSSGKQKGYIKVHPDFRAIFTSNPEEYVGVHKTQDALLDRMITMRLDYQDRETESAIVTAKSGRSRQDSEVIVDIVRALRKRLGGMNGPTVRSAIAIARILDHRGADVNPADSVFLVTCKDVLYFHLSRQGDAGVSEEEAESIIRQLGQTTAPQSIAGDAVTENETVPAGYAPSGDATEVPAADAADAVDPVGSSPAVGESIPGATVSSETRPAETPDSDTGEERVLEQAVALERELSTHVQPDQGRGVDDCESDDSGTASPQQMLEAAVSRFCRPPKLGNAAPSPGFVS